MSFTSHSTGENRLLNVSRRTIQDEALQSQKARADATRASQPFATPTVDLKTRTYTSAGVNPNAAQIQPSYDPVTGAQTGGIITNFDYNSATPEQRAEQDRLMRLAGSVAGAPRVAQAVTPNSLTTGAMGQAGATGDITKQTNPLGQIDRGAIDRLMKEKGMYYDQAFQTVQDLRPSVQQTMSNTGLAGQVSAVAPFKSIADQVAEAGNSAVEQLIRGNIHDPALHMQARQAAVDNFLRLKQTEQANQQIETSRQLRGIQSSAAGATYNQQSQVVPSQPPSQVPTPISPSTISPVNMADQGKINKQQFVSQQRALGKSDAEIRKMLRQMGPQAFSGEQGAQTISQPTPQAGPTPQQGQQPSAQQGTAPSTDGSGAMQKDGTQGNQDMPQTPMYPPQASAVRDMMVQLAKDNPLVGLYAAMYDEDVMRIEQAKASALLSLGASIQGAEQENLDTQAYIDKWVNIANQNSNKLTGLLQSNSDETNKVLEQQKNNALQKLEFDRQVQTQQLEKQKAADVLKSSIAIGLRGGAYSGAAQNALAESEREWDVAIQNLGKEYSFKAADVMTDYTAKYVTAKQSLALNLLQASETLQNKIEGYANAGFSSLQAKKKAITQAHNDYRSTHDAILKDHATNLKSYVKEMGEMVNKKRDDERAQEQLGINMLDKLVDTYGNNVPPSLLETVKKYIPNIDIQDVMKRRTLAQMKKVAGGTGGITGFSLSQRTPTGKPQTLEQFIETKQKDFNTKMSGPASPEMRKEWEKEYQAKLAIDTQNTAEQLMKEWTIKRAGAGNFPNLGTMKAVEADFQNAVKAGELDFARQILDGIGPRPVTAIAEKVTTTQQLVSDLDGMENLLDEIEQNVGAFPTKGKLWTFINENIETTPEYARLRQYVDTNLTPYARTVSGERGASTEPDVQRAMSSLLDPNVDAPALRAALAQAKKRVAMSSTLLLKNLRDSGYRVNALQESNDKFMNQYQQVPSPIPQSTQDWFNKF